jgi:16S rRNA (cytosine967-C5)-methyltransferase
LCAWLAELHAALRAGRRPDVELSAILRQEHPDEALRRRLVRASAAWFRWSRVLGLDVARLHPRELDGLLRLERVAAGAGGAAEALAVAGWTGDPADLLPAWIRDGLPAGTDAAALALAFLRPPNPWLRAVDEPRLRAGLGGLAESLRPHPLLPGAWRLATKEDLYGTAGFREGAFVLQDPASQAIGAACGARPGEHWLDLCAGAGGKSLQLASAMDGRGLVHAFDIHDKRLEELRRRAKRQGVFNLVARQWDGERLPPLPRLRGVLVDAPCTGSGTLRRNPDLWHRSAPDLAQLTAIQDSLLERAAALLPAGGRLVYATCSVLEAENDERVAALRERHPGWVPAHLADPLTGRPAEGILRIRPTDGDQDGTFVAVLERA